MVLPYTDTCGTVHVVGGDSLPKLCSTCSMCTSASLNQSRHQGIQSPVWIPCVLDFLVLWYMPCCISRHKGRLLLPFLYVCSLTMSTIRAKPIFDFWPAVRLGLLPWLHTSPWSQDIKCLYIIFDPRHTRDKTFQQVQQWYVYCIHCMVCVHVSKCVIVSCREMSMISVLVTVYDWLMSYACQWYEFVTGQDIWYY